VNPTDLFTHPAYWWFPGNLYHPLVAGNDDIKPLSPDGKVLMAWWLAATLALFFVFVAGLYWLVRDHKPKM
jgi:hypothetical protein